MICERCLMEMNIARPFRIVLRKTERSIGYLKFCTSCYHTKNFLDTISVMGFIALLIVLLYLILYGQTKESSWIIYSLCIALILLEIKLSLYLIRNAWYFTVGKQLIQSPTDYITTSEMVCYKDRPEKFRTITIDISKMLFYISAISLVWFVYKRFSMDYVPYIALFIFSVISGLCVWFFCHVFFYDLINDIRTPTKDVLEKLKDTHRARQNAMKHADRKVYRDPEFTRVDNYMTYIVFGRKGPDLAEPGGQAGRVMALLGGRLKSSLSGPLRFLHKARERTAGSRPGELDKTGPPRSSQR